MKLRKEILTHPQIPKPLHGLNPRTIKGKEWWDRMRFEAYRLQDQRCCACGVHKSNAKGPKWLEAHEYYDIDYVRGVVTCTDIVGLCHYCHNFIHSGRLSMIIGKEKSTQEVKDILQHGFDVLRGTGLQCFPFTMDFAHDLGVRTWDVDAYDIPISTVPWEDWRLLLDGELYKPLFNSHDEWRKHYSNE